MGAIVLMMAVLLLFGVVPLWNFSRRWRYGRTSLMGIVLATVLVLMVLGCVPRAL